MNISDQIEGIIEAEVTKRTAGYRGAIAKSITELQSALDTPQDVHVLKDTKDDDPIVPPGTPEDAGSPAAKELSIAEKARQSRKNIIKKTNGVEYK